MKKLDLKSIRMQLIIQCKVTSWLTPKEKKELISEGYRVEIVSGRVNTTYKKQYF